jgi:hypothetical protein
MGWLVQQYEDEVHVLPESDDEPHILTADCWCGPRPTSDHVPGLWLHRDELERSGPSEP